MTAAPKIPVKSAGEAKTAEPHLPYRFEAPEYQNAVEKGTPAVLVEDRIHFWNDAKGGPGKGATTAGAALTGQSSLADLSSKTDGSYS